VLTLRHSEAPPFNAAVAACYTCRAMMEKRSAQRYLVELTLCLWMIGTQVWYYAQFRALFGAFARAFLHR
jgi:hypothetical protein